MRSHSRSSVSGHRVKIAADIWRPARYSFSTTPMERSGGCACFSERSIGSFHYRRRITGSRRARRFLAEQPQVGVELAAMVLVFVVSEFEESPYGERSVWRFHRPG